MKRIYLLILILTLILPASSLAATLDNVGIIPGNIWYSNYPLVSGTEVKIYTAIFNGSVYTVQGAVTFNDNGVYITKAPFLIPAGQLNEVSVDWVPKQGSHKVSAAITDVKIVVQGSSPTPATLEAVVRAEGTVTVAPPPPPSAVKQNITSSNASAATNPNSSSNINGVSSSLAGSLDKLDSLASSSLGAVVDSATSFMPEQLSSPLVSAVRSVNTRAESSGAKLVGAKESVRADLAALKARDNQLGESSLSQSSAIASFAPLRWLASLYDRLTGALSSYVLGDLPNKVTSAEAGVASGVKKPFQYLWFFILSVAAYILTHTWLLWIIIVLVAVLIVRVVYRKWSYRSYYSH